MSAAAVRRILVDGRPVDHPTARARGIGRYTAGFLAGLATTGVHVTAAVSSGVEADVLRSSSPNLDVRPWSPSLVRDVAADSGWYVATQLMLHPVSLDPIPRAVTEARLPVAAVMYDVIPHRYPSRYLVDPNAKKLADVRTMLARTVDGMLAISEFSARTAAEELSYPLERIRVIGAGVETIFEPAAKVERSRLRRLVSLGVRTRRGLVVAVTGGDERKNTDGLLRAWGMLPAELRESSQLVVACGAGPSVLASWRHVAASVGLRDGVDVVFTDAVSDDEMVTLLQSSALAVFPSFDEGFGLPVAEAAACGRPVICSNTTSLPEVIDCDEALFDPYDPMAIARAIEWGLTDDAHRARLVDAAQRARQRWTWDRVGRDAVDALNAFTASRARRAVPNPARVPSRVAFVAPSAESPSGIGAYSAAVCGSWPTNHVVRFDEVSGSDARPPRGSWSAGALGRYVPVHDHDHVVVALGSSPYHASSVSVAERWPTHVWLHEASLVGCHVGIAHLSGNTEWAHRMLSDRLGARAAEFDDLLDGAEYHRRGVTFLEPVLNTARSVIVSSQAAADVIRRVMPGHPPMLVLPLAFPDLEPVVDPPARSLVTAGWLDSNKRPEVLVRVAARLGVDITFVGEANGTSADAVRALASELGVAARVHLVGRVTNDEYDRHLRSHRVGIQLRDDASGQMSAAVNDLVARGIPVVTSMTSHAAIAEGGLQHVVSTANDEAMANLVVDLVAPLLDDDNSWRAASATEARYAASWRFTDVSRRVARWLDESTNLPAGHLEMAEPR